MTTQAAGPTSVRRKTTATRVTGGKGPVLQTSDYTHHVLIGRFQPFHNGHEDLIGQSLKLGARKITIQIGSASTARNPRNPLRFPERKVLIEGALETSSNSEIRAALRDGAITILPLSDRTYDNTGWAASVQENIRTSLLMTSDSQRTKTAIIGYSKDPSTSMYLKMFGPLYGQINTRPYQHLGQSLDASAIRQMLLISKDPAALLERSSGMQVMSESVRSGLIQFIRGTAEYRIGLTPWQYVKAEYDAVERGRDRWVPAGRKLDRGLALQMATAITEKYGEDLARKFEEVLNWNLPYDLTFNAADAVVIQSGNVLMTERNIWPGKGLLAFPGGHLNPGETLLQCALRELREEVRLDLPEETLLACLKGEFVLDDPHRSLRGRYVSLMHLFHLNPRPTLPKIAGDGVEVRGTFWMPINEVLEEDCFEDHHHGLQKIKAQIRD